MQTLPARQRTAAKDSHQDTGNSTLVALLVLTAARQRLTRHSSEAQSQLRAALSQDETVSMWVREAFAMPSTGGSQPVGNRRQSYGGLAA